MVNEARITRILKAYDQGACDKNEAIDSIRDQLLRGAVMPNYVVINGAMDRAKKIVATHIVVSAERSLAKRIGVSTASERLGDRA